MWHSVGDSRGGTGWRSPFWVGGARRGTRGRAESLKISFFSSSGSTSNLKALFDFVRTSLTPAGGDSWRGPVLLVDDLSLLLSLGASPVAVLDFIHYCRVVVCSQLQVPLPPCASTPGFVSFTFLCPVGFWKALFLQKVQIIIPRPILGACIKAWGPPARFFAAGFPRGAVGRAPRAPDVGTHPPFAIYTTATSLLARVRNKVDSVKFCCSPPRIVPGCLPCKR